MVILIGLPQLLWGMYDCGFESYFGSGGDFQPYIDQVNVESHVIRSIPNTLPQTRKTILLLLLICGDNAAATNPGPNALPLLNPCTRWDAWERNREYNEKRDKELYREFRRKATINRKDSERGIWMKVEEFIEQHIEWNEEIKGNNEKNTSIRKKNERKNQILENWRRIRENEDSEDQYRRSEDRWRGRKKRVRISDGKITKKRDNITINNRYKVLEDLEEIEEIERREGRRNVKKTKSDGNRPLGDNGQRSPSILNTPPNFHIANIQNILAKTTDGKKCKYVKENLKIKFLSE